ncbi:c-type cytochrome [Luteolibacter sp. AS25]|uniref:c-type cytochrome n=1 Tax=Luteolibacter sp. AS25 TaxID=3135776 RepID=UPI00398AE7A3
MEYLFPSLIAQIQPAEEPKEKPEDSKDVAKKEDGPPASAELLETGKQQYLICAACHGQQGEGLATGPPLAGSEWVNGPVENLIKIQLRGLEGPIRVKGEEYNIAGGMAPLAYQSDQQIAGVLSYIRSSFGNSASAVTTEQVAALREEAGKPQITVDELEEPESANGPPLTETGEPLPAPDKYKDLDTSSGIPFWIILVILALIVVCLRLVLKKK